MRHLLTLKDLSADEIKYLIKLGREIKRNPGGFREVLAGKTMAMIFMKTSTRTRVSFEAGMFKLGGHAIYLDWRTTNFTLGSVEDEIRCLARYVDVIMARVFEHEMLEKMARFSSVPVINGLSDSYHPCQALADVMLITELFPDYRNIKVAFIGDGSNNVASSLILACTKMGIKISVGAPKRYGVRKDIISYLKKEGLSDLLEITSDPVKAAKNADILYTDTWISMGQEAEKEERVAVFRNYSVNKRLHSVTNNAYIMHCLPAHRNFEITGEMIESPRSRVFEQAENRMYVQMAVLIRLLR